MILECRVPPNHLDRLPIKQADHDDVDDEDDDDDIHSGDEFQNKKRRDRFGVL